MAQSDTNESILEVIAEMRGVISRVESRTMALEDAGKYMSLFARASEIYPLSPHSLEGSVFEDDE